MAESRKNFRVHAHFTSRVPGAASQSRAPRMHLWLLPGCVKGSQSSLIPVCCLGKTDICDPYLVCSFGKTSICILVCSFSVIHFSHFKCLNFKIKSIMVKIFIHFRCEIKAILSHFNCLISIFFNHIYSFQV